MRIEKLMKKIIVIVLSFAVINSTITSSVAIDVYKRQDYFKR